MTGLQRRKPELWTRAHQRVESSKLLAAIKYASKKRGLENKVGTKESQ